MDKQKAVERVREAFVFVYQDWQSAEAPALAASEAEEVIAALSEPGLLAAQEMYKAVVDHYGESLPPHLRDFLKARLEEARGN